MELVVSGINWWAVAMSVVAAQIISTLWFTVLFGESWAREYGASNKQQHTKEIPGYTYGVQFLCTVVLVVSLAILQQVLGVVSPAASALVVSLLLAIGICVATGLPGQAFLKRWRVAAITLGCQISMIAATLFILGFWG